MQDKDSARWSAEDNEYVSHFAMTVFMKADNQDRNERANVDTAKAFYAASLFFEILHVFGELQSDFQQKQMYAAWRAAEIWKSLNRKRNSVSHLIIRNEDESSDYKISGVDGSPGQISDLQVSEMSEVTGDRSYDIETDEWEDHTASSSTPDHQSHGESDPTKHTSDGKTVASLPRSGHESSRGPDSDRDIKDDGIKQSADEDVNPDDATTEVENPSYLPSSTTIADAHKVAKMAVSSLSFNDVPSAISFLKEALTLLTIP